MGLSIWFSNNIIVIFILRQYEIGCSDGGICYYMKKRFLVIFFLLVFGLVFAADNPFLGTWDCIDQSNSHLVLQFGEDYAFRWAELFPEKRSYMYDYMEGVYAYNEGKNEVILIPSMLYRVQNGEKQETDLLGSEAVNFSYARFTGSTGFLQLDTTMFRLNNELSIENLIAKQTELQKTVTPTPAKNQETPVVIQETVVQETNENNRVVTKGKNISFLQNQPVLVTSFGQSTDAAMIDTILKRVGVKYTYGPTASSDIIKNYKTVIVAVGASELGMGAAGITEEEETARAKAIMQAIEEYGVKVIFCHIGGTSRRGVLSDEYADMVMPKASFIVVKEDANYDKKFSDYAEEHGTPISLIYATKDALTVFSELFSDSASSSANTTIKVWYSISGTNGQFFESQVQAFMAQNPQIKVELTYTGSYADSATKISAAKLAGNSPDVIITSASQLYTGEDGNFMMEENVKDPEFDLTDVRSGILEYANYMGRQAAVPFSISTQVIYYNKDLAAKAGYDLEANPPKTWEEFLRVAKAIQNKCSKGTYGFDTSDSKWLVKNMLFQNGNEIVKVDVTGNVTPVFAEESGIEVARYWKKLVDEKVMPKSQHDNAENKFLSGKLVFIAATSNRIAKWAESVQFNIGAIEMPYFKEQKVALGGSTAAIMTTDPVRHAASWALLKFLLNTENQTAYALTTGYLPIRESSLDIPEVQAYMEKSDLYSTAIRQLDYSTAYIHFGEMGSMDTQLTWALDDIENGTDPKRAFQNAVENLIAELI